jgi:hypothetical protein
MRATDWVDLRRGLGEREPQITQIGPDEKKSGVGRFSSDRGVCPREVRDRPLPRRRAIPPSVPICEICG